MLYNYTSGLGKKASTSKVVEGCTTTTTGYREPAYLTDNEDADASKENTPKITQDSLQSEYNKMITSVKKYGGFYVGRYEMSLTGLDTSSVDVNGTAQSKANVKTASAGESELGNWYGLYAKAKTKTYANENNVGTTITDSGVVSSLIWGSQWDAMLNWMQKSGIDAKARGEDTSINKSKITGKNKDEVNNIYDLYGCNYEYTLAAEGTNLRIVQSGSSNDLRPLNNNVGFPPCYPNDENSGRLTLYIK